MTILWMTCERKAETSSSVEHVEHFVMEDSQILTLEKLWMGYGPQFDLRAYAEPTRKSEPNMDFWKLGTVIF